MELKRQSSAFGLALLLGLVLACKRKATTEPQGVPLGATVAATSVASATTLLPSHGSSAPFQQPSTAELERACRALVEAWKSAQNSGDRAAYQALYHPAKFTGLKRVHSGKVERFDFSGWMQDRSNAFRTPFEVAVEELEVETWLQPGSSLRNGISRVQFLQRWRNAKYADHGPKSLLLWRDPHGGQLRIVFEELLLSRQGWEDETARPTWSPQDLAQGLTGLGINLQNAAAVGAAALASPQLGVFTRALVSRGSLNCLRHVAYESCGEVREDWGAVENADIDHACVRRAVLLPILESGRLSEEQLLALRPELLQILEFSPPDPAWVIAMSKALAALPRRLAVPFAQTAVNAKHSDASYEKLYALLDEPTALDMARRSQRAEVVLHLDPARHAEALHALHTRGITLPNGTMTRVIGALQAAGRAELLEQLVEDAACEVAMAAAAALANQGRPEYLPKWAGVTTLEGAFTAVCRLRFDANEARRDAELSKFFHPSRPLKRLHLQDSLSMSTEYEAALREQAQEQTAAQRALNDEVAALLNVTQAYTLREASADVIQPSVKDWMTTTAFDEPRPDNPLHVVGFEVFEGHIYVRFFGSYTLNDQRCPC